MNIGGQNVCSALIPMSFPTGKEKHHDSRSQRLKHQLATVNEASLASAKSPPPFFSHSFAPTFFLSQLLYYYCTDKSLVTLKTSERRDLFPLECNSQEWKSKNLPLGKGEIPSGNCDLQSKLLCLHIKSIRIGHFLHVQWVFKNAEFVKIMRSIWPISNILCCRPSSSLTFRKHYPPASDVSGV